MNKPLPDALEEVLASLQRSSRYDRIYPELVSRLAAQEIQKRKNSRDAAKHTRARLYQIGGAFISEALDFKAWEAELSGISNEQDRPALMEFCRRMMNSHVSTRERLPYLEEFYGRIFDGLDGIHSILDLGCGLNPLSIPWMPLSHDFSYYGCDIFLDLLAFNQTFLDHIQAAGRFWACDLSQETHFPPTNVALLLKTLPLIDQLDKKAALRLLETIPAPMLILSFPTLSIGGRNKGMQDFYSSRFETLVQEKSWYVTTLHFPNELVYRLQKA